MADFIINQQASPFFAGMPTVTLTDVTRLRLDSISFFLFLIVIATVVVRWCWNTISLDFPKLPQLSFRQSLAFVTLWGLVFLLALTMISGARELMTPGAWEKQGLTYKVRTVIPEFESSIEMRRRHLSSLYALLCDYASEHDDEFPKTLEDAIADPMWIYPPAVTDVPYNYDSGRRLGQRGARLLSEPNIYQGPRLSLYIGGVIVEERADEK